MSNSLSSIVKLGAYCEKIDSGSTPRGGSSVYQEFGVSFIRSQNVYNGWFTRSGIAHLNDYHAQRLEGVSLCSGDILLNITGDSVARCCMVPDDILPARVNQHVAIIRPLPECFNPRFLTYYFISHYMQSMMLSLAGSGSTRKALTKEMIQNFVVPKPPMTLQNTIAGIFSAYDDLIENNRRRMTLLEEAARQIYREWFVRLRFPGYEHTKIVNGVPEGWEKAPFETALILQRGFDLPSQSREDGEIPVYGASGINGYHNTAKVAGPGIVTGRSGTIGDVQYVPYDFWPLNTALWVKEFKKVSPLFALFSMREMDLKQYNGGASVPSLDRKAVHRIEILIPPKTLLSIFDELAADFFRQIDNLSQQNEKLRAARDLLLPRLMSGEISV